MEQILLNAVIFVSVLMLFFGVKAAFFRPKTDEAQEAQKRTLPLFFSTFEKETTMLGNLMGSGDSPSDRALAKLITLTALPLTVRMVRGAQILGAVMGGIVGLFGTMLVSTDSSRVVIGLVVGLLLGWCMPTSWVRRCADGRKMSISKELPFAIDLVTVSMQAGQEFGAAVRQVVKESGKTVLAMEFAVMLKEVELGKSRIDALKTMGARIQLEEFMGLVSAVEQGTEMGASITKTLQIQAEELRRIRYHRAERKAARAPSLMIMPMALFILPSIFIIIFVPLLLQLRDTGFFNAMGGG